MVTTGWVPPLFAVAGVGIGVLYWGFDSIGLGSKDESSFRTWPRTVLSISTFVSLYYISGLLSAMHLAHSTIFEVLSALAVAQVTVFDASLTGLIVASMLAVFGPGVECILMTYLPDGSSYAYLDVDTFGLFPAWIAPVYAAGGPAVGGLARQFFGRERERERKRVQSE